MAATSALALLLVGLVPTAAHAAGATVVVNQFTRTPDSPSVQWSVTLTVTGVATCGCTASVQAVKSDGTTVGLGTTGVTGTTTKIATFGGTSNFFQAIVGVRTYFYGTGQPATYSDLVPIEDPFVTQFSMTVEAFGRDANYVEWQVRATGAHLGPEVNSPCSSSACMLYVIGKRADGTSVDLTPDQHSTSTSGVKLTSTQQYSLNLVLSARSLAYQSLPFIEIQVHGVNGLVRSSGPLPTGDVVPDAPLALEIIDFNRERHTVMWSVNATAAGIGPEVQNPCSSTSCSLWLQGMQPNGTWVTLPIDNPTVGCGGCVKLSGAEQFELNRLLTGTSSAQYQTLQQLRLKVVGPSSATVYSDAVATEDSAPASAVVVSVESRTNGSITYELHAQGLDDQTAGACAPSTSCLLTLIGKFADGSTTTLYSTYRTYDYQRAWTDISRTDSADASLVAVRGQAVGSGPSGASTSSWIPISSWVVDNHDLTFAEDAFAAMVVAAGLQAACTQLALYPGTHTQGSSLNDQSLACTAGVQSGLSARQIFQSLVQQFGPSIAAMVEVAEQVGAPSSTDTPGTVWTWPGWPYNDPGSAGAPAPPRPIQAPPAGNPTYTATLADDLVARGMITKYGFAVVAVREHAEEVARACYANSVFSGFKPDDCRDAIIFSPGSDVFQAAKHDWDAIINQASHQPALLDYRTRIEREAAGVYQGWYASAPYGCQGSVAEGTACDEYPFYSSQQSGPGASLRIIDAAQNSREGLYWYGVAKVCGAEPPSSLNRQILVVPIPFEDGPVSSGWCSD